MAHYALPTAKQGTFDKDHLVRIRSSRPVRIGCVSSVSFDRVSGGGLVQLVTAEHGLQNSIGSGANFDTANFTTSPYIAARSVVATGAVSGFLGTTVTAPFTDPSAFTVAFSPNSIDLTNSDTAHGFTANSFNSFNYSFTVDRDTVVQFDYNFRVSGTYAASGAPPVVNYGLARQVAPGQSLDFIEKGHLTGSGSLSFVTIGAGSYYTFLTANIDGSTYAPMDTAARSTSANGSASFTLLQAAVPEPASWATMVLGFAVIGGTQRGRRRIAARA